MVRSNRTIANLGTALDSGTSTEFLGLGDSGVLFEPVAWEDITSKPTVLDSASTIALFDSAYVQARQSGGGIDSAGVTGIVDSAYVQARKSGGGLDSAKVTNLIDSAYIAARVTSGLDSAGVTGLVDSSYVTDRFSANSGFDWYLYTATAGQKVFDSTDDNGETLSYSQDGILVFYNGILMLKTYDYTATDGTSVTLVDSADSGANLVVVKYGIGSSSSPASFTWGGDRGIVLGGTTISSYTGSTNVIQYYDITTSGDASDFGDLSATRYTNTAVSSQTRVVTMGGMSGAGNIHNWMEYVTPSSTGNSTSFGSLPNYAYYQFQGASNGTYGLYGGGWSSTTSGGTNSDGAYGAAPFTYTDGIDYITISTTGNGTDFGNFSSAGGRSGSAADSTRAVWHLAVSGSYNNILEYVTINTPGNTTDFGDISVSRNFTQGCSDLTRGLYGGGGTSTPPYSTNVIDYITIQTTGNATDFGDLTSNKQGAGASSNGTYATFVGGWLSNPANYAMDIVTIQTTGNATDHGDLTTNVYNPAAGSGNPS